MPVASTDKPTETVTDAVYQVRLPDGRTKKRYVKTTRTYGGDVEAEIVLDREHPENHGKTLTLSSDLLCEPDTFPKFMYQPATWLTKANYSVEELKAEASAVIDSWFKTEGMILRAQAAGIDPISDTAKILEAIKTMLTGYFGGFSLVLILHWLKGKLDSRLASGNPVHVAMPFERKLGSMKETLKLRQENLNTPVDQRGAYNANHPYGVPRQVQQFGQPA